ncbi:hypothetical protein FJ693_06960 [Georgenia yuyongxinii]|uniref:Htaa domain-containing protein n=1 Tax=Georgenia yuyongxinii TaxID=2589797 RepID=A0A552WTL1_9MICO|nr:hypothetical protein FJ693_06960 [Georgenia yuyongxinii]
MSPGLSHRRAADHAPVECPWGDPIRLTNMTVDSRVLAESGVSGPWTAPTGAHVATTPGLTWAVKDSLMSYVVALDDGTVEALAPASRSEDGFFFPSDEAMMSGEPGNLGGGGDPEAPEGGFQFLGAVRLTGHWGMLDVELREPRVTLSGGAGTLLVRERGARAPGTWLPFADLTVDASRLSASDGTGTLTATASLTGHGRLLLGGQYEAGTALSPVHITLRHG